MARCPDRNCCAPRTDGADSPLVSCVVQPDFDAESGLRTMPLLGTNGLQTLKQHSGSWPSTTTQMLTLNCGLQSSQRLSKQLMLMQLLHQHMIQTWPTSSHRHRSLSRAQALGQPHLQHRQETSLHLKILGARLVVHLTMSRCSQIVSSQAQGVQGLTVPAATVKRLTVPITNTKANQTAALGLNAAQENVQNWMREQKRAGKIEQTKRKRKLRRWN